MQSLRRDMRIYRQDVQNRSNRRLPKCARILHYENSSPNIRKGRQRFKEHFPYSIHALPRRKNCAYHEDYIQRARYQRTIEPIGQQSFSSNGMFSFLSIFVLIRQMITSAHRVQFLQAAFFCLLAFVFLFLNLPPSQTPARFTRITKKGRQTLNFII